MNIKKVLSLIMCCLFFSIFHTTGQGIIKKGSKYEYDQLIYSKKDLWKILKVDQDAYALYKKSKSKQRVANIFGSVSLVSILGIGVYSYSLQHCEGSPCLRHVGPVIGLLTTAIVTGIIGITANADAEIEFKEALRMFNENHKSKLGAQFLELNKDMNLPIQFGLSFSF